MLVSSVHGATNDSMPFFSFFNQFVEHPALAFSSAVHVCFPSEFILVAPKPILTEIS